MIVFLTGVFPTIFAVTGAIMWLRKRAHRRAIEDKRGPRNCGPQNDANRL